MNAGDDGIRDAVRNRDTHDQPNFVGQTFWARGYFLSNVGRDEQVIREYIRNHEAEDRRLQRLQLLR